MNEPTPVPRSSTEQFYPRAFAIIALAVLAALLWRLLQPLASALAWALLLAFLLNPVQVRLVRWLRGRSTLSSLLLTVGMLIMFIGPLAALGVAFAGQAASLVDKLQSGFGSLRDTGLGNLKSIPIVGAALDWIERNTIISDEQARDWLITSTRSAVEHIGSVGGSLFVGAMGTVVGFVLTLFLLFFFLRDGARMQARLVSLIPMPEARKRDLGAYLGAVTRAVVFGTLLTALLQGALVGIGFAIVGLPSPVVFAVLASILSLLPIGGTAFVWVPAAIVLVVQGRYGAAIFLTVWGVLLVGLIDNLLKPLLISGRAEVPTLAAFLGVLGGLAAFGPIGMFLGPVLLALTIALIKWAEERRLTAQ